MLSTFVANDMTINFNVFCTFVKDGISGNLCGTPIITIYSDGFMVGDVEIFHQVLKSHSLTSSVG